MRRGYARMFGALAALVILSAGAARAGSTRYALCVGIDHYNTSPANDLWSCINDAHGVFTRLAKDTSLWDSTNMTLLTDAQATEAAIRGWFSTMAATAGSGDLLVYFHSSHGGTLGGTSAYLCPYNISTQEYLDSELAADLAALPAGVKVVIIIDACHSGGMFKGAGGKADWPFMQNVMKKYNAIKGPKTSADNIGWITACDYDTTCNAGMPYSQFAEHFIGGFATGTRTFKQLFDYAKPRADDGNQSAQYDEGAALVLTSTIAACQYFPPATANENWETGNLTGNYSWTTGGDANWAISGTRHAGLYSAQSGSIGDDEYTYLELADHTTIDGEFSFWQRISCEDYWDYYVFEIDGQVVNTATGSTDWQYVSYWLDAGSHTFTWIYVKDFMDEGGSDCVWIDDIKFPGSPPNAVATNDGPKPTYTAVTLDAQDSTDVNHDIATWEWDLDEDGQYDDDSGETVVLPADQWTDDGTYTVGLKVTDDLGLYDTTTTTVTITNRAPTALGDVDTTTRVIGESVDCTDNGSHDNPIATPDGTVEKWIWDFGDGTTAAAFDAGTNVYHHWTAAGDYDVKLKVVDDDDDVSTEITVDTVTVTGPMTDTDGDGLPDAWETDYHESDPLNDFSDTGDYDGDGLSDADEYANNTDPANTDTDGDGHDDSAEVSHGTNPLDPDSRPSSGGGGGGGGCSAGGGGAGWWAMIAALAAALVALRRRASAACR